MTRIERGPQTFTRQEHEKLVAGPEPMIMIPPRHYCIIQNPVQRCVLIPLTQRFQLSFADLSLAFSLTNRKMIRSIIFGIKILSEMGCDA